MMVVSSRTRTGGRQGAATGGGIEQRRVVVAAEGDNVRLAGERPFRAGHFFIGADSKDSEPVPQYRNRLPPIQILKEINAGDHICQWQNCCALCFVWNSAGESTQSWD
jgi:hypothetical protein